VQNDEPSFSADVRSRLRLGGNRAIFPPPAHHARVHRQCVQGLRRRQSPRNFDSAGCVWTYHPRRRTRVGERARRLAAYSRLMSTWRSSTASKRATPSLGPRSGPAPCSSGSVPPRRCSGSASSSLVSDTPVTPGLRGASGVSAARAIEARTAKGFPRTQPRHHATPELAAPGSRRVRWSAMSFGPTHPEIGCAGVPGL
jgi:hypothetical protein